MKPLLVIILGCIPLGVLTVSALVELGAIQNRVTVQGAIDDVAPGTEPADQTRADAETDNRMARELAGVELLAGETIPALQALPPESRWAKFGDAWQQWTTARRCIADFLQADRSAATAEVDELQEAARQLEGLKEKCREAGIAGRQQLVAIVDRRMAAIGREIAQRKRQQEADALLAAAQAAFAPQRYGECVTLCDRLLSQFTDVLEPGTVEKVRILQERAQFWDDTQRLFSQLEADERPDARAALLEGFLGRYSGRDDRTTAELRVLQQCDARLRELNIEREAQKQSLAAAKLIQGLNDRLPAGFDNRLEAAAQIADRYPADTVKAALRASVDRWLREFLPEKHVDEHPLLREAETTGGAIVRGFFKDVPGDGGTVVGYKRYPTYEWFVKPVAEVGTYRKEDLKAAPAPSVPRQCATQYNQARERLLEDPGKREAWTGFADLCDALGERLRAYRAKPGAAAGEQPSFDREARFARRLLDGGGFERLTRITGP